MEYGAPAKRSKKSPDKSPDAQRLEEDVTLIAAYALCILSDTSQYKEPKRFRRTREELKARLDFWNREKQTKAARTVIITVPAEHNDRLNDVLLAALDQAWEEIKASATAEQAVHFAERLAGIRRLTQQQPRQIADYSLVATDADLLFDELFRSVKDEEADSDPWPAWVDSLIPALREAMA